MTCISYFKESASAHLPGIINVHMLVDRRSLLDAIAFHVQPHVHAYVRSLLDAIDFSCAASNACACA